MNVFVSRNYFGLRLSFSPRKDVGFTKHKWFREHVHSVHFIIFCLFYYHFGGKIYLIENRMNKEKHTVCKILLFALQY